MSAGQETLKVLAERFDDLLLRWTEAQSEEGVQRTDVFSKKEVREQSTRLLRAFLDGAKGGDLDDPDLSTESWADLRDALREVSEERTERGVTPTQMATFIHALKTPLFEFLTDRIDDSKALAAELIVAARLVDAFALHTTEAFIEHREKVIERQRAEMIELSSPVVELWKGILAIPLIGALDSARAQEVMENLLEAIVERQAEIVIVDITGVRTVDTQVAQHLLRTAAAVRLMGAECIISGISPTIAQTMVQLGVDVGEVLTRASIRDALVHGFNKLGWDIQSIKRPDEHAGRRDGRGGRV
ncbi:MAG: STAS domain-containing protein [Oceanicaulis sp.]